MHTIFGAKDKPVTSSAWIRVGRIFDPSCNIAFFKRAFKLKKYGRNYLPSPQSMYRFLCQQSGSFKFLSQMSLALILGEQRRWHQTFPSTKLCNWFDNTSNGFKTTSVRTMSSVFCFQHDFRTCCCIMFHSLQLVLSPTAHALESAPIIHQRKSLCWIHSTCCQIKRQQIGDSVQR